MDKVREKDLYAVLERMNRVVNGRPDTYVPETREFVPGAYRIDGAYGGWRVERIEGVNGTVEGDVLLTGYVSRRALYQAMQAFLRGVEVGRKLDGVR